MANVLFKRGNTATISSTAIADGQLLWNTVTGEMWEDVGTSRIACGKLVTNTLAEVLAITADGVSCGTKPVKELNDKIGTWVDITNQVDKSFFVESLQALYNPATKEVKITIFCDSTLMSTGGTVLGLPLAYRPTVGVAIHNGGIAKKEASLGVSDWNPATIGVYANGIVAAIFYTGVDMRYLQGTFSYIVR